MIISPTKKKKIAILLLLLIIITIIIIIPAIAEVLVLQMKPDIWSLNKSISTLMTTV